MSKEFYDYIAKNIIHFFRTTDQKGELRPGERYSLRLDDEEMVLGVNDALKEMTKKTSTMGIYEYKDVYRTFTIKLHSTELVVAAKIEGMKDDFLATLRNEKLTEKCFPILMITYSPIDTIISGTGDLSSAGMPFNVKNIIKSIKKEIDETIKTIADKEMLLYELEKKQKDRFSDKTSLFEYSALLTIIGRGKVIKEDYSSFALLPDDELANLTDSRKIIKALDENHKIFEELSYSFKYEDLEAALEKKYDDTFIRDLTKKKKNRREWFENISVQDVKASVEKRNRKKEHPLVITDENIIAYSGSPLEYTFIPNELAYLCSDGESKAKQRKKNLLIYNPEKKKKVGIRIDSNIAAKSLVINCSGNIQLSRSSNSVELSIPSTGCDFAYIDLKDEVNNIKYVIKICILELNEKALETINTRYLIECAQKLTKPKLVIQNVNDDIVLNVDGNKKSEEVVTENAIIPCDFDTALHLLVKDEEFNLDDDKIQFVLKYGLIEIPFEVYNREKQKQELNGENVFKMKFDSHIHFKYNSRSKTITSGTTPYLTKGSYKDKLSLESLFIENGWLAIKDNGDGDFVEYAIELPTEIEKAFGELVDLIKGKGQLPSLVCYADKDYRTVALNYVHAVEKYIDSIENGKTLSDKDNAVLLLGCVIEKNWKSIQLSPLHPINVLFQVVLADEKQVEDILADLVCRVSPRYLLPYLYGSKKTLFKVIDDTDAPEWLTFTRIQNKFDRASKAFIKKLTAEKIKEYKKHFDFLFEGINNPTLCINLINMGDCAEILNGLILHYQRLIGDEVDEYDRFELNIYGSDINNNKFKLLEKRASIQEYLEDRKTNENVKELTELLTSHVSCFFIDNNNSEYKYAHLTFYEMTTKTQIGKVHMNDIVTGTSLNGLISGVPSVLNEGYYKTGFGIKYAKQDDELIKLAKKYNSLYAVAFSVDTYEPELGLVTTIPKDNKEALDSIYESSNWVIFVDPKVDLTYFNDNNPQKDVMIIHYSDQLSSSSSYDDITVTNKSEQYIAIITEQLHKRGVKVHENDVRNVINLFNAVNGSWLLQLITAKKLFGAADSNFSREKMSILAAIKVCIALFKHSKITWIPVSLEEILRVSGGTGLSSKEGILSAKNLGFDQRPTCDDILMIGIEDNNGQLKVYFHPVEVKIGNNDRTYITKAVTQVTHTHDELIKCVGFNHKESDALPFKLIRNFLLQTAIVSAGKMKMYGIDNAYNWDNVLDTYRQRLLNDEYVVSDFIDNIIGAGTVISFKKDAHIPEIYSSDDVRVIELPEALGSEWISRPMDDIDELMSADPIIKKGLLRNTYVDVNGALFTNGAGSSVSLGSLSDDSEVTSNTHIEVDPNIVSSCSQNGKGSNKEMSNATNQNEIVSEGENAVKLEFETEENDYLEKKKEIPGTEKIEIEVVFGTDNVTGEKVIWTPNDTNILFHPNTGIIGTMGTGKTQFTKSMISQLYHEQKNNVDGTPIGILIFDYKGDYNESKVDFFENVNAKVYKPYCLPINPLVLTQGRVFKPLLPIHTANSFKDTLSKVYQLGPKQQTTLFNCVLAAYAERGIMSEDPSTWDNEAPTFNDVYRIYSNDPDIKKGDTLTSLMVKLNTFKIFESDPKKTHSLFDLLDGVVVIDLSSFDPDIQNMVVAITLDIFYSQMQAHGSSKLQGSYRELTKIILVDEADNFMSQDFPSLKKIMKEGREFGVGTILSTQFLDHFGSGEDDYSKYILTWVVHNVSNLKTSDVDFVFNVEPKGTKEKVLFNDIKRLEKHHSIVKIGNEDAKYIKDLAFWQLNKEY